MYLLLGLTVVSFLFSRRPRSPWEMAVCGALAIFAVRSVRHTPLFSIAALAFVPPYLAGFFERFRDAIAQREAAFLARPAQLLGGAFLAVTGAGILAATFTLHKEHPLTMEVPRKQFPVSAVQFMRESELKGNLLVFFDWGEMCMWELPDCPVSIDGRLDTSYPRELISEHWKFYNATPVDPKILDLNKADLALLPVSLAGAVALGKVPGWRAVYFDDLAVVLVKQSERFPKLAGLQGPVEGAASATAGRAVFPPQPSERLSRAKAP
jgi:hypothetical protein